MTSLIEGEAVCSVWFWASTDRMTVGFEVLPDDTVGECAPIIRRFRGQHWLRLSEWLSKQEGYVLERADRLVVPASSLRPCDECGCPQPPHRCFCSFCFRFTHERRWRAELADQANQVPHKDGKNVDLLWPELNAVRRDVKILHIR